MQERGIGAAVILGQSCERIAAGMEKSRAVLPFPVLCDEDRAVIKRYGVWHPIGIDAFNLARPASFLIDAASRRVRYAFVGSAQHERAPMDTILAAATRSEA